MALLFKRRAVPTPCEAAPPPSAWRPARIVRAWVDAEHAVVAAGQKAVELVVDAGEVYWAAGGELQRRAHGVSILAQSKRGGSVRTIAAEDVGSIALAADESGLYWCTYEGLRYAAPGARGPQTLVALPRQAGYELGGPLRPCIALDASSVYLSVGDTVLRVEKGGGCEAAPWRTRSSLRELCVDAWYVYVLLSHGASGGRPGEWTLASAPKDGGELSTLAFGHEEARGLAMDDDTLYWATWGAARGTLCAMAKSGGEPRALVSGCPPISRVVASGDWLYFSCADASGSVMRIPRRGGEPVAIVPPLPHVTGICAFDLDRAHLYWADTFRGRIVRSPR